MGERQKGGGGGGGGEGRNSIILRVGALRLGTRLDWNA